MNTKELQKQAREEFESVFTLGDSIDRCLDSDDESQTTRELMKQKLYIVIASTVEATRAERDKEIVEFIKKEIRNAPLEVQMSKSSMILGDIINHITSK